MSTISSVEALRAVVGDPPPGVEAKLEDHLNDFALRFIEKCPFLVLSTSDRQGRVDASPKGDAPGFISVQDEKTLLIPDRPGNRLAFGHLNVIENPQVGLLLVIPNTSETLRINGSAELTADPDVLESLAARGKPAVLAIRVAVEECFFHCGKAFIRSGLWKPDSWGEKHRVSFGEMYAARAGEDKTVADNVDAMIEQDYRENL